MRWRSRATRRARQPRGSFVLTPSTLALGGDRAELLQGLEPLPPSGLGRGDGGLRPGRAEHPLSGPLHRLHGGWAGRREPNSGRRDRRDRGDDLRPQGRPYRRRRARFLDVAPPEIEPILGIYVAQMGPICANGSSTPRRTWSDQVCASWVTGARAPGAGRRRRRGRPPDWPVRPRQWRGERRPGRSDSTTTRRGRPGSG